jgi:hypothetical protein
MIVFVWRPHAGAFIGILVCSVLALGVKIEVNGYLATLPEVYLA